METYGFARERFGQPGIDLGFRMVGSDPVPVGNAIFVPDPQQCLAVAAPQVTRRADSPVAGQLDLGTRIDIEQHDGLRLSIGTLRHVDTLVLCVEAEWIVRRAIALTLVHQTPFVAIASISDIAAVVHGASNKTHLAI